MAGHQLAPSISAKCLGHWWLWDLSLSMKPLQKQGSVFLLVGAVGAFDGQLNPLSGRAIFEYVLSQFSFTTVRTGSSLSLFLKLRLVIEYWHSHVPLRSCDLSFAGIEVFHCIQRCPHSRV